MACGMLHQLESPTPLRRSEVVIVLLQSCQAFWCDAARRAFRSQATAELAAGERGVPSL
jgi:hypothetical protein